MLDTEALPELKLRIEKVVLTLVEDHHLPYEGRYPKLVFMSRIPGSEDIIQDNLFHVHQVAHELVKADHWELVGRDHQSQSCQHTEFVVSSFSGNQYHIDSSQLYNHHSLSQLFISLL